MLREEQFYERQGGGVHGVDGGSEGMRTTFQHVSSSLIARRVLDASVECGRRTVKRKTNVDQLP